MLKEVFVNITKDFVKRRTNEFNVILVNDEIINAYRERAD